ncbi:uncharacterized protein LOC126846038 [Adelges cooleyi]|uniref:uncharacterized protein LOC126846038 n=1 Tax=Adelges cooleyi TaxID=133065 RepID=UPI00217FFAE3|nr:uncharacterized protein LOC126846038 [Adelges cooleyi]
MHRSGATPKDLTDPIWFDLLKKGSGLMKTEFGGRYVDQLMIAKMQLGEDNLTKNCKTNCVLRHRCEESTGLNSGQIEKCIEVYKNREDIPNFMKQDFGIKNLEEFFQYKPNETYYINAMRSLMALAHAGTIDNFEEPTLMAIEVEFYVKKFFKRTEDTGQHGYLNREQLLSLFEDLNIQGDEMLKA